MRSEKIAWYFLIGVLLLLVFMCGRESANPCIEYSSDCEIECGGVGDAYDCWESCPCVRRKYD